MNHAEENGFKRNSLELQRQELKNEKFVLFHYWVDDFIICRVNDDLLQGTSEGNITLVKRSLEQRAELETKNSEGETALIIASLVWFTRDSDVSF